MNRRTALKSLAGIAVSLVPTWRLTMPIHEIDLKAFCNPESCRIYNFTTPFTQLIADFPYRFATDAKICVRIPESAVMPDMPDENFPPASRLPWEFDGGGWRAWPAKEHLLARDTICPTCDGEGFVVRNGQASECKRCDEKGVGIFPGIQRVGHVLIDSHYDALIRRQIGECEYRVQLQRTTGSMRSDGKWRPPTITDQVQIRFRGGDAILMPLVPGAEERLVKGKV